MITSQYLIDETFFTGSLSLAVVSTRDEDIELLYKIIGECQEKYLKSLLGDDLYLQLIDDLNYYTFEPTTQKFIDLVNGKIYLNPITDRNVDYKGIKTMLAGFTWCQYMKLLETNTTPAGEKQAAFPNSQQNSLLNKYTMNYQTAYTLYYKAKLFIDYSNDLIEDTYENFDFTEINKLNHFGI